ncbi:MAG: LysM peptidoglycan-binding domain-containing protein [Myxococcales bacterium]|nr:LysM peptidoglycan-binding domain-containing protein [Myxococcales bacterium]
MAQTSGASTEKAFFTNKDSGDVFYVQYNPKEFKLDDKALWKPSEEVDQNTPQLMFERGDPSTVSMDLIFDSTDSDDNVHEKYVAPLRAFLASSVDANDQQNSELKRPPHCVFTWGSFTFDCVVEKVSATFLMFRSDGTPMRARVSIQLKEFEGVGSRSGGGISLSGLGSIVSGASSAASVYTTGVGDTLSSVAAMTGAKIKDIAMANGIADPMELAAGADLVIPATSELAAVLGDQLRAQAPGDWSADSVSGNVGGFSFEASEDSVTVGGSGDLGDAFVSFDTSGD